MDDYKLFAYMLQNPEHYHYYQEHLKEVRLDDPWVKYAFDLCSLIQDQIGAIPTDVEQFRYIVKTRSPLIDKPEQLHMFLGLVEALYNPDCINGIDRLVIGDHFFNKEKESIAKKLTDFNHIPTKEEMDELQSRMLRLSDTAYGDADDWALPLSDDELLASPEELDQERGEPISTGLPRWDKWLDGGWFRKEQVLFLALPGFGKAQPLSCPILTENGYVPMRDIHVGSRVFDSSGKKVSVTAVYPQGMKSTYRVSFNDGTETYCCGEHLWSVRRGHQKGWRTMSTEEIISNKVQDLDGKLRWRVPVVEPLEMDANEQSLDPYLLGMLLGNACLKFNTVSFSSGDRELIDSVAANLPPGITVKKSSGKYDYRLTGGSKGPNASSLVNHLRALGLMRKSSSQKFVPNCYLIASIEQRRAVLAGILDTDGHAIARGGIEYLTASYQLREDVIFLVQSLGGIARKNKDKEVDGIPYYRLHIKLNDQPFRLTRKAEAWIAPTRYPCARLIESIEPYDAQECQCITVDSPTSTYLTNDCIVTHNTLILLHMAIQAAMAGHRVIFYSMDNPLWETKKKIRAHISGIPIGTKITNDEWQRAIEPYVGKFKASNLLIRNWPRGQKSMIDVRADVGKVFAKYGSADMFFLDYINVMKPVTSLKGQTYEELNQTAMMAAGLAEEFNMANINAGQSDKSALQMETQDMGNAAGAFALNRHAALTITVNQKAQDMAQDRIWLAVAKGRRSRTRYKAPFKMDRSVFKLTELDQEYQLMGEDGENLAKIKKSRKDDEQETNKVMRDVLTPKIRLRKKPTEG